MASTGQAEAGEMRDGVHEEVVRCLQEARF